MLTVKVHQHQQDGTREEEIFSAFRVSSTYEQEEGEPKQQVVIIHMANGETISFYVLPNTCIYVENLAKETVQAYKSGHHKR